MYTLELLYFLQCSILSLNHLFIHGPILLVFRAVITIIVDSSHQVFIEGRSSFITIRNDLPRSDTPVHLISENGLSGGTTNTGSGGGASRSNNATTVGRDGGSGLVLLWYLS